MAMSTTATNTNTARVPTPPGAPGFLGGRTPLEHRTAAIALLLLFRTKVHLAHDLREHLVDVGTALGRGLHEGTAPQLRQRSALG